MLSASLIEPKFMTTKLLRLGACTLFLASASLLHAAIAPAENLLPADTLAFFTVPNYTAFRASSQDAPLSRLWNDPAMKPFHDKFMAKWNETYIAPLEKDLGLKVADFLALPQGQLTFAVTVNGSNGHDDTPPGLLLLLDAKDKSSALKTNLAALTKKWTDAGRKLRTETIHGLAFTVVPLSSNDFAGILPKKTPVSEIGKEPKPVKPGEMYFAQYQSLLVAGNTASVVETVAAHLTGGSVPAIADDTIFAGDKLSQFRDAPTCYGWFNGNKFVNLLTANDAGSPDDSQPAMMPKFTATKIIGAIGLGGLKSISATVRQTPEGMNLALHVTAPESSRAGLLKILSLSAKDSGIPAFVPADVVKFSRFRLDGKQAWNELQKMVEALSPQYSLALNSAIAMVNSLAQAKDPSFDLRTSLFGNLGDDVIIYTKPPTGDRLADLLKAPVIYLVAVVNPEQVINGVRNLAAVMAPQESAPAPRDFLGHKIYSLTQRQKQLPNGTATPPAYLYAAASGGYVAMSKDAGILEEFIRSADGKLKPLNETPGLAELANHVGGLGGGLFSFENQHETMRTTFKFLKSAATSGAAARIFPPTVGDWADFGLLPEYDSVSKYFYRSVVGGNANADGLTLKIFTPRPPQLD